MYRIIKHLFKNLVPQLDYSVSIFGTSLQKKLVLYVSINKQPRNFQNWFGLLSRRC
jgi:hypothetical protein